MANPVNLIFVNTMAALIGGIICWIFFQRAISDSSIQQKALWHVGSTVFIGALCIAAVGAAVTQRFTVAPSALYVAGTVAVVITVNVSLLVFSRSYRQIIGSASLPWLIALNALRIGPGVVFLGLLDMGLLPRDFAIQAGYGDILTGLIALAVAYLIARQVRYARETAIVWCILGLLDLLNALYLGQTTIPGWITMLASQGQSVDYINWFLIIPMAPVPLFLVIHILLFRKLGLFQPRPVERQVVRAATE